MNLEKYRASEREQLRTSDLLRLIPSRGLMALDVGARDGYFSKLLADRFESVTALDLTLPTITDERIQCVEGNLLHLMYADKSFDFVLCAEVLEHIPSESLQQACRELSRVTNGSLLVGVPYKQDLRFHCTSCSTCGAINPPWGHVNSFDLNRLRALFNGFDDVEVSFVGSTKDVTNKLSALLMSFAGNPFGTYDQEEPCMNCGNKLTPPEERNISQRIATRAAHWLTCTQQYFSKPRANWIHILLRRRF